MISIKHIKWAKIESKNNGNHGDYYIAMVRDCTFLQLHDIDGNGLFYIHTTFPTFKVHGNSGVGEWGKMKLEDAKKLAEELIRKEILSFIDMRDYNIERILK